VTVRTFCAFAVATLTLTPMAGIAATSPSPGTMRAALADPIDPSYVEADVGAAGTLEGPFDAEAYATYSGLDVQTGQAMVRSLQRNGFVGGYGRQWYQPRGSGYLGELVMVFTRSSGASSIANASKIRYQQDAGFQSLVEPHLNLGSFGVTEVSAGYHWTAVLFEKGNNLFAISQGSIGDFMTSQALAQARRAYAFAPSTIAGSAPSSAQAGFARYLRLIAAAGVMLLLAIAAVVATIVVLVRTRRPGPGAAARSQPKA